MSEKEQLEQELWILEMKDHFTHKDYEKKQELLNRIKELEENESKRIF